MIVEHFDRRTMAAMEAALEMTCACWPNGGKYNLRKQVAQSIIRCAKTGNTTLDALTQAGERALAQLAQSNKRVAKLKGADIQSDWQYAAYEREQGPVAQPSRGSRMRERAPSAFSQANKSYRVTGEDPCRTFSSAS
jgi:hypothetical protein